MVRIEKIMIVDDDEDIRTICALSARTVGGWEVVVADSGEDALAKIAEAKPDVVLLDVMMPGMNGLTTLARLRERPETAETPVILLTARVQPHEVDRYRAAGATGVIAKPFDPMTLPDEIRRLANPGED